jgi:hypothetical protein
MSSITISINRNINDGSSDYSFLFELCDQFRDMESSNIAFDFTGCGFLQQNAVAIIGSLIRLLQKQQNAIKFRMESIEQQVRVNLEQNGFLHRLGLGGPPWNGNSIQYREDFSLLEDEYAEYLADRWLGKGWISISPMLRESVVRLKNWTEKGLA